MIVVTHIVVFLTGIVIGVIANDFYRNDFRDDDFRD